MTSNNTTEIDSQTLSNWLKAGKNVSILDIRSLSERAEWRIPQSLHADVYDALKAGNEKALDFLSFDKNIPVVSLCAGGKLSLFATEILSRKGYEAYSLSGGMKAWNYAWDTAIVQMENVTILQIRRVAKGCLSYLIGSGEQAMVIDASLDPYVYMNLATENGWKIEYATDTHIHADYVSRTKELVQASGAKHLMIGTANVLYDFVPVTNEEIIKIGDTHLQVLHTPGHTYESVSWVLTDKALFTGDTLFTDGIGRPDLKADEEESKSKAIMLFSSLQQLMAFDSRMMVFPAHVSKSIVLGQEAITATLEQLKNDIAALSLEKQDFVNGILANLPPTPPNYLTIAEINRKGNSTEYNLADLEAGANRCAIQ
ncbi:MBL fold metallo-hydrolase [Runella sp. SP2]|uniref:MBL fold metallo-hydrolase n=1 Tax=Runella sp. SP2 TaxID=2268026 RepID=UPI000F07E36A|nr:MBL fold metallo-hydrolase [Runella sp. SP2]AYQ31922.1 MBL fold metallo-hydrolase [Runella sp. SP2]